MPSIGRIPAKHDAVAALAASGSPLSRRAACALALTAAASALAGCVDQHPERAGGDGEPRLVATSPAVAEICDKLDMDLIGIPATSRGIPERYEGLPEVGGAMAPDLEILKSLRPDYVISPNSLQADLQPKYAGAGSCLDLRRSQKRRRAVRVGGVPGREVRPAGGGAGAGG